MSLVSDSSLIVMPTKVATLKIKKSGNDLIELPFTTQKPIARSLAVFQDGQIHYNPLVHSGDFLDSGVKVRLGNNTYALASQIYDPVIYDSSGATWNVVGNPKVHERGFLELDGASSVQSTFTINPTADGGFNFSGKAIPTYINGEAHAVFEILGDNTGYNNRIAVYINTSTNKLVVHFNSNTILGTTSYALQEGETYNINVSFYNNTCTFTVNGEVICTKSASIVSKSYTVYIGARSETGRRHGWIGYISDVYFSTPLSATHHLTFGN